jgi:hypothetical protein
MAGQNDQGSRAGSKFGFSRLKNKISSRSKAKDVVKLSPEAQATGSASSGPNITSEALVPAAARDVSLILPPGADEQSDANAASASDIVDSRTLSPPPQLLAAVDTRCERFEKSGEERGAVHEETIPISQLWNEAYETLRELDKSLVINYELALSRSASENEVPASLDHAKFGRKEQMAVILEGKLEEVQQNTWKLKFGGKEVPVKDLMEPVVGIIEKANRYINSALSANPYASIAWAGVGLLLPVCTTTDSLHVREALLTTSAILEPFEASNRSSQGSRLH